MWNQKISEGRSIKCCVTTGKFQCSLTIVVQLKFSVFDRLYIIIIYKNIFRHVFKIAVHSRFLSVGQEFDKKFLNSTHVLKVYFKLNRKNPDFVFLPLPTLPASVKNGHLCELPVTYCNGIKGLSSRAQWYSCVHIS